MAYVPNVSDDKLPASTKALAKAMGSRFPITGIAKPAERQYFDFLLRSMDIVVGQKEKIDWRSFTRTWNGSNVVAGRSDMGYKWPTDLSARYRILVENQVRNRLEAESTSAVAAMREEVRAAQRGREGPEPHDLSGKAFRDFCSVEVEPS